MSFSIKCLNHNFFILATLLMSMQNLAIGGEGTSLSMLPVGDLQKGRFLEPQSKTLITKQDIEKSGAKDLIDVLRMIPGIIVDPISGNQLRINYLGGPSYRSRRLQVLIDGVSYFLPNLARVKLTELPVRLEDIAVVEFIHGPSTALYKENAFSGTLNITTIDPRDANQFFSSVSTGSEEQQSYYLQWAANDNFKRAHRTSINFHSDTGYDRSDFSDDAHDSTYAYQGYHRSHFSVNSNTDISFILNFFRGNLQREFDNFFQTTFPESQVENYVISFDITKEIGMKHLIKFDAYFNASKRDTQLDFAISTAFLTPEATFLVENYPQLAYDVFVYKTKSIADLSADELILVAPALGVIGIYGSEITTGSVANKFSDERTTDLEFSYEYSDIKNTLYSNLGMKHKLIDNPFNYFGERYYLEDYRLVINGRRIFNHTASFNLGFLYEYTDLIGESISPRMAFVFKLNKGSFLRISAASAERNPNLYETNHVSRYFLERIQPEFEGEDTVLISTGLKGNIELENEKINSYSVSYTMKKHSSMLEVRFFYNEYRDLISGTLSDESLTFNTNNGQAIRKGVGVEYAYDIDKWYLKAGYVYQESSATNDSELELDFRNTGSLHLGYLPIKNWQINLGYAGHNIGFTGSYDQYDFSVKARQNNFSVIYNLVYFPNITFNNFEEPGSGVASDNYPVEYNDSTLHKLTIGYQIP